MEDQIILIEKYLKESKNKYTFQRRMMFKAVKWYKYPLVILSAISTIILGLELGEAWIQWQKNSALVVTAIITLLTTLMTFWNVEEYWLQNKVIEQQITTLQQKFEYERAKGFTEESLAAMFKEYQGILGQQHSYWKNALDDIGDADNQ